jgi:hypothetical protein
VRFLISVFYTYKSYLDYPIQSPRTKDWKKLLILKIEAESHLVHAESAQKNLRVNKGAHKSFLLTLNVHFILSHNILFQPSMKI